MKFRTIETIAVIVFSLLLAPILVCCVIAAKTFFASDPPNWEKTVTALGVFGAIGLGLYNSWLAWAKAGDGRLKRRAGWKMVISRSKQNDPPVACLACRLENRTSKDIHVTAITIQRTTTTDFTGEQWEYILNDEWNNRLPIKTTIKSGRHLEIVWPKMSLIEIQNYGIKGIVFTFEVGDKLVVQYKHQAVVEV